MVANRIDKQFPSILIFVHVAKDRKTARNMISLVFLLSYSVCLCLIFEFLNYGCEIKTAKQNHVYIVQSTSIFVIKCLR